MQLDQQQAIDALIIAGKLEPAVTLYRTITGTALIGAKMYVYDRAALLKTNAVPAPAPRRMATPAPGIVTPRRDRIVPAAPAQAAKGKDGFGKLVVWVIVIAVAVNVAKTAVRTRGFGVFTIVNAPYYRTLVTAIQRQPKFRAQLGKPIAVDGPGVYCPESSTASNGDRSSDCMLPASGSRTPADDGAYVQAHSTIAGHAVRFDLTLHVRNLAYEATYVQRPPAGKE